MELWFANSTILYTLMVGVIQKYAYQKYSRWDDISQTLPPVRLYLRNYRLVKWGPLVIYFTIPFFLFSAGVFQDGTTVLILSSLQQLVGLGIIGWFISDLSEEWSLDYLLIFFWAYLLPELYRYNHMFFDLFSLLGTNFNYWQILAYLRFIGIFLYVFFPLFYIAYRLYKTYQNREDSDWHDILFYGSAFAGFFIIDSLSRLLGLWYKVEDSYDYYRIVLPLSDVTIFVAIFVGFCLVFQYMAPLTLTVSRSFDYRQLILLFFILTLLFQPLGTSSHYDTGVINSENYGHTSTYQIEFPSSGRLHMYMIWPEPAQVNWSVTDHDTEVEYEMIDNTTISRNSKNLRQIHLVMDVVSDEMYNLSYGINITDSDYYQLEIYFYLISSLYILSNWTGVYAFILMFVASQSRLEVKNKDDQ